MVSGGCGNAWQGWRLSVSTHSENWVFACQDKCRNEAEQTPNHLTIFLANGSTLRFEGVIAVIRTTNKELQSFKYKSMSDGLIKVFNLYNDELIVSISIYEDGKN